MREIAETLAGEEESVVKNHSPMSAAAAIKARIGKLETDNEQITQNRRPNRHKETA